MHTAPPIQQPSVRMLTVVFGSSGLALVLALGFSLLACSGGFLFSGVSIFSTVLVAVAFCAAVVSVTSIVFRQRQRRFGWHMLLIEVAVLALVAVGIVSWLDTRQHLRIFMNPSPVPSGLRVHQGRSILFSSYVHFTAPPDSIASLLQSKGLVEVPAELSDGRDTGPWSSRDHSGVPDGWWQPLTMSSPRFFFRHHESQAVQGWSEGWWVNGATNEVYAFISG